MASTCAGTRVKRFRLQGVLMMRKKVLSLEASETKEAERRVANFYVFMSSGKGTTAAYRICANVTQIFLISL